MMKITCDGYHLYHFILLFSSSHHEFCLQLCYYCYYVITDKTISVNSWTEQVPVFLLSLILETQTDNTEISNLFIKIFSESFSIKNLFIMLQEAIYIYTKSQLNPANCIGRLIWQIFMDLVKNYNFTCKLGSFKKYRHSAMYKTIKKLGLVYMWIIFQFPVY